MNSESVLNVPNSACTFEASITSNENVETILNAFLLFKGKQLQKAKLQISRIQQLISHIKISYKYVWNGLFKYKIYPFSIVHLYMWSCTKKVKSRKSEKRRSRFWRPMLSKIMGLDTAPPQFNSAWKTLPAKKKNFPQMKLVESTQIRNLNLSKSQLYTCQCSIDYTNPYYSILNRNCV
jgi:hypothetical protein